MSDYKRYVEKRNGENVIPLRNAVCGIDMPKWELRTANDNEMFLSGEAVDRLAELESENERLNRLREVDYKTMTTLRQANTDLNKCMDEMQDRIAELETKIENGTLVELPQPTNKFAIVEYYGQKNKPLKIVEYRLLSYNLSTKKIEKLWYCSNTRFSIIVEDIATKPEAEAKLRELKGEV